MAQGFAPNDGAFDAAIPDREVARLVLDLDRLITLNRQTTASRYQVHGKSLPVPETLGRAELMVLIALVQTYGPLLFGSDFDAVRERMAECGAVVLLQQVVCGDRPDRATKEVHAGGMAARLQDARPILEELCRRFPDLFLAEAWSLLARFTTRRATPDDGQDEWGNDG